MVRGAQTIGRLEHAARRPSSNAGTSMLSSSLWIDSVCICVHENVKRLVSFAVCSSLPSKQTIAASENETSELISSLHARHEAELRASEHRLQIAAAAHKEELERMRSEAEHSLQTTSGTMAATVAEAQAAAESAHAAAAVASNRVAMLEA